MANSLLLLVCLASVWIVFMNILSLPFMASGISSCGGSCQTLDDCAGQLICIDGKCDDDPELGTHTCGGGSLPTPDPPSSSTPAILTNNNFEEGGDGGGPSECDGKYHDNSQKIVALSTRWYDHGSRSGNMIKITVPNGRSVLAKVVDECDESDGCPNDIVDGSDGVWNALGLDIDIGEVHVTWSMA